MCDSMRSADPQALGWLGRGAQPAAYRTAKIAKGWEKMTVKELIEALKRIDAEGTSLVFFADGSGNDIPIDTVTATWTKGDLSSVVLS